MGRAPAPPRRRRRGEAEKTKARAVVALGGLALVGYAVAGPGPVGSIRTRSGPSTRPSSTAGASWPTSRGSRSARVVNLRAIEQTGRLVSTPLPAAGSGGVPPRLRWRYVERRRDLRVAALLGAVALYVNLPAFVATADAARRRGLWLGGTTHCVDDYLARRDMLDVARTAVAGPRPLCRYIITASGGPRSACCSCCFRPLRRRRPSGQ